MTTADYPCLARPKSRSDFEVGSLLTRALDAWRCWVAERRALRELRQLDERALRDIGLNRSTIYLAAREAHGYGANGYGVD